MRPLRFVFNWIAILTLPVKRLLCKVKHRWVEDWNSDPKHPPFEPSPNNLYRGLQRNYRRDCKRCGRKEFRYQDIFGNVWWRQS